MERTNFDHFRPTLQAKTEAMLQTPKVEERFIHFNLLSEALRRYFDCFLFNNFIISYAFVSNARRAVQKLECIISVDILL